MPRWGPDSPGPGEAHVVTRVPGSGRGPGKDQIQQVQEAHVGTESPGMGEVLVATPLTRSGEASLQSRVTRTFEALVETGVTR